MCGKFIFSLEENSLTFLSQISLHIRVVMSRWDAASRFKNWLGWFVNGSQFDKLASSGSLFMSRTLCGKLNNLKNKKVRLSD